MQSSEVEKDPDGQWLLFFQSRSQRNMMRSSEISGINIFVGLTEKAKKLTIEITLPKQAYIA